MKQDVVHKIEKLDELVREFETLYTEVDTMFDEQYAEDFIEDEKDRQENVLTLLYELKSMYETSLRQYLIIEQEFED